MDEILNLGQDALQELLKGLTLYAAGKMQRLTWRGARIARGGSVPGAHGPNDFAVDAITKAIDGKRSWNRERYRTLESFLCSVIDSDINHLVMSLDNKIVRSLSSASEKNDGSITYDVPDTGADPLQIVIDGEFRSRLREVAEKELKGEEFLVKMLECLEAGITERAEIAEYLGVTVKDVDNERKRLRRKLSSLYTRVKPSSKRAKP